MYKVNVFALIFFVIGSVLHTLAQVDAIARAKNNPMSSRVEIFLSRWATILIRGAWGLAIFVLWLQGQLVGILTSLKIPLPDMVMVILGLHVGSAIAFIAGYNVDSA